MPFSPKFITRSRHTTWGVAHVSGRMVDPRGLGDGDGAFVPSHTTLLARGGSPHSHTPRGTALKSEALPSGIIQKERGFRGQRNQGNRIGAKKKTPSQGPRACSGPLSIFSRPDRLELYRIVKVNFGEDPFRNCLKRGSSNAPSVDLAGVPGSKRANGAPSVPSRATVRTSSGLFRQFLERLYEKWSSGGDPIL